MTNYRKLNEIEIQTLKNQGCSAVDWNNVEVAQDFKTDYIYYTRFSGVVKLGVFEYEFSLAGGMKKHAGLYHTTLHNVTVGNHCCIENVKNYIANYEIGDYAFTYCTNFSEIIIPYGVTRIGFGTFSNCSITSITIPDSVTVIDAVAFSDSGLTSITIPDSVQKIEMGAFSGCINLTSVKLPSNLTDIEIDLFAKCWNLENIEIPQTVTRIGAGAFDDCFGLVSITIPKSVTMIGATAFGDCTGLESIVFENTENWKSYLTSTNGNPIDVTDPVKNAAYFTKAGYSTYWKRG